MDALKCYIHTNAHYNMSLHTTATGYSCNNIYHVACAAQINFILHYFWPWCNVGDVPEYCRSRQNVDCWNGERDVLDDNGDNRVYLTVEDQSEHLLFSQ